MLTPDDIRAVPLFASLSDAALDRLARTCADIRLNAGEFAVHEGGERALYAVLSGRIEVVKKFDGVERTLGWRLPGTIFGEVPLAFATPFPGGYRAAEPSRVMRVEPQHYFAIASSAPEVAEQARRAGARAHRWPAGRRDAGAQGADHRLRRALGPGLRRAAPLPVAQPDRARLAVARDTGPGALVARQPAGGVDVPGRAPGRRHAVAPADAARTGRAAGPADTPRAGGVRHADHRRRPGRAWRPRCTARAKACARWSSSARRPAGRPAPRRASRTTSDFPTASRATSWPAARCSRRAGSAPRSSSRAASRAWTRRRAKSSSTAASACARAASSWPPA